MFVDGGNYRARPGGLDHELITVVVAAGGLLKLNNMIGKPGATIAAGPPVSFSQQVLSPALTILLTPAGPIPQHKDRIVPD